ncbi:MAG: nucleotide exchange factor GrpE, partial [Lachnospiraceae bacterium]|nr:nucleotide exchange factor GrpE [Lachnospiraceae bacterium]
MMRNLEEENVPDIDLEELADETVAVNPEKEIPSEETHEEIKAAEQEGLPTWKNEPDEEESEGEKRGFRKKPRTDKKQEAAKERVAELEDRVIRQMAEFENFRRRTEKEKSLMFETGARSIIEKMLPVVDNFERGLAAIPEG